MAGLQVIVQKIFRGVPSTGRYGHSTERRRHFLCHQRRAAEKILE